MSDTTPWREERLEVLKRINKNKIHHEQMAIFANVIDSKIFFIRDMQTVLIFELLRE